MRSVRYLGLAWFIFLALILTGCNRVGSGSLSGEWRFIYLQKSPVSAPPRFDVLEFEDSDSISLHDSLSRSTYHGKYALEGTKADISFVAPGVEEPIEQTWDLELQSMGMILIVKMQGAEAVYQNAYAFSKEDLSGRWSNQQFGTKGMMTLGEDGSYLVEEGENKLKGYYRLWRSGQGDTMTLTYFVPEHGVFTGSMNYKRRGDVLTMTPIGPEGPADQNAIQWQLVK